MDVLRVDAGGGVGAAVIVAVVHFDGQFHGGVELAVREFRVGKRGERDREQRQGQQDSKQTFHGSFLL